MRRRSAEAERDPIDGVDWSGGTQQEASTHPGAETAPPRLTKGASVPAACVDVSDLSQDGT